MADLEEYLLCSYLDKPERISSKNPIQPYMLLDPTNRLIYQHMINIYRRDNELSIDRLLVELKGKVSPTDLFDIFEGYNQKKDYKFYQQRVYDDYSKLKCCNIIDTFSSEIEKAVSVTETIDNLMAKLSALKLKQDEEQTVNYVSNALLELADLDIVEFQRLKTGYPEIDAILNGGFRGDELITIGGTPGTGKTAFVLNLSVNNKNKRGLIFQTEMTAVSYIARMVSLVTRESFILGKSKMCDIDAKKSEELMSFSDSMVIDTETSITPQYILSRFKEENEKSKIHYVVIDYLQQLGGNKKFSTKREFVEDTVKDIKNYQKETGVPWILLSQLNIRDLTTKPTMHSFLESGKIEQASDVCILLWDTQEGTEGCSKIRVSVAKNRNGSVENELFLTFKKSIQKFYTNEVLANANA